METKGVYNLGCTLAGVRLVCPLLAGGGDGRGLCRKDLCCDSMNFVYVRKSCVGFNVL